MVERAIKIVPKFYIIDVFLYQNELNKLKIMDHSNVVKLFEWYEDKKCF